VVAPQNPPRHPALARDVALYSAARLALVAVIALLLLLAGVPLLVALLLALVVALPLSVLLLGSLRARVNAGLAVAGERRRAERDRLRRQFRGEKP
jgi:Flp pilus assembly protein TadB